MYALSEKAGEKLHIDNLNRRSDYFGPMVCGFTSGAVFKSTGTYAYFILTCSGTTWFHCCWLDWDGSCGCDSIYSEYSSPETGR